MNEFLTSWSPRILSVLRIIIGFLFLWHGSQKLLGFPPSQSSGGGDLSPTMWVGAILEFGGGILTMVGLFTRWIAFVLSGLMAVAYFGWHASNGFLPLVNRGELAVVYCFVFFYFWFASGGPWSLDALFKKSQ